MTDPICNLLSEIDTRDTIDTLDTFAKIEELNKRYRGTSLIRNRPILAPYSRCMSRDLWWS